MLSKLLIKNFIIIEATEIDFFSGFNSIIGETGAGKSIIIDALMLLLGGKGNVDYVREGTNKAIIEGSFFFERDKTELFNTLNDLDICNETNEIIIRREISLKGNSRCFINDTPVTIAVLKSFCNKIFDLHSQNEELKILEKTEQLKIIDALLPDITILIDYKNSEEHYKQLLSEYNSLLSKKNNAIEKQEILTKLLNEITTIDPQYDEDKQITSELIMLENAEELVLIIDDIVNTLENEEHSLINGLNEIAKHITQLTTIDSSFTQYKTEFDAAIITIKETEQFVTKYKNNIEFNAERIEILRNRFIELRKLIKKYGSLNDAIDKQNEYEKEFSLLENFDDNITKIKSQVENSKIKLTKKAAELTNQRHQTANIFSTNLINELANLGIENADIKFNFYAENVNDVEFLISMNKGENVAPINEIASGGEVSRIMLAIKKLLAAKDNTPILIFDEIDTGTSGKIAQRIGKAMQGLSNYHQVISITHLPQIAAMGSNIIVIEKKEINNRTITTSRKLNEDDKINEIAKMLSGENITEAAIKTAKELIDSA